MDPRGSEERVAHRQIVMPASYPDPEAIITETIYKHARGDIERLARAIIEELWEAGYDIRPRGDDVIPIRGPKP